MNNNMNESQDFNKLIDILLEYIKEYHLKKFDPFYMRERQTFDINEYGMKWFDILNYSKAYPSLILTNSYCNTKSVHNIRRHKC